MRFFEMLKDRDKHRYPSSLYRNFGVSQHVGRSTQHALHFTPNAADNADDVLSVMASVSTAKSLRGVPLSDVLLNRKRDDAAI